LKIISSVNQTLLDIKANDKPVIMVFNKIDAYQHLTIDEDDLMTENAKTLHARRVESDLDEPVGEENALFISATHKENFEEFRERVYEAVRQIHITRFPTTNSCIGLQRRGREEKTEEENE
jgi:GTP-binding protein HflX